MDFYSNSFKYNVVFELVNSATGMKLKQLIRSKTINATQTLRRIFAFNKNSCHLKADAAAITNQNCFLKACPIQIYSSAAPTQVETNALLNLIFGQLAEKLHLQQTPIRKTINVVKFDSTSFVDLLYDAPFPFAKSPHTWVFSL